MYIRMCINLFPVLSHFSKSAIHYIIINGKKLKRIVSILDWKSKLKRIWEDNDVG